MEIQGRGSHKGSWSRATVSKRMGKVAWPTAMLSMGRLRSAHRVLINRSLVTLVKPISEEG